MKPPRSKHNQQPDASSWSFYDANYAHTRNTSAQPNHITGQQDATGNTPTAAPGISNWMRSPRVKWAGLLLLVLLLGALGSTMIFASGENNDGGGQTPATPARTTSNPSPTVIPTPTPEPEATPTTGQPTPTATPQSGQADTLPAGWIDSGRGVAEFYEAADVAERFTNSYESLDWRSKNTFDNATFALTPAALTRFNQHDERANPTFIAQFQHNKKILRARVLYSQTRILQTQQRSDAFFTWMQVTYSQFHQQKGSADFTDTHTIVVLLISVPFGSNGVVGGVGWLVAGWQEGNTVFPIPQPAYQ